MVLSYAEKMSLAASIDEVRASILIDMQDDYYAPEEREWFRKLIPALDHASNKISGARMSERQRRSTGRQAS